METPLEEVADAGDTTVVIGTEDFNGVDNTQTAGVSGAGVSGAGWDADGVQLPLHWFMYMDEQSGYPYYLNEHTGESRWERPI